VVCLGWSHGSGASGHSQLFGSEKTRALLVWAGLSTTQNRELPAGSPALGRCPSDENRSRGDGLDKSKLASGCSIKWKKKKLGFFRTQLRGQNHLLTLTPTYQIPDATQRWWDFRAGNFDKYSPSCSESPLLPKEGACRSIFGLRGGMDGRALLLVGSRLAEEAALSI